MRVLQLIVIYIIVGILAFGTGYFMGAIKISKLSSEIESLTEDLKGKEFRILLLQVKDHVRMASIDVSEKNFGIAGQEIVTARETLSKGIENITEKYKISAKKIDLVLAEVQGELDALNIKVKEKINTLISEIDRVLIAGV